MSTSGRNSLHGRRDLAGSSDVEIGVRAGAQFHVRGHALQTGLTHLPR